MPSKNEVKVYVENGFYHLFNRGVEKRIIFVEAQDYTTFLSYLKTYLLPKNERELQKKLLDPKTHFQEKDKISKLLRLNNFSDTLSLFAYCLMPNHFHLLIKQKEATTIHKFMNSLTTRYVMYFNKKYKRVGPLFQGLYKAVLVETNEQLLHLSRYIHYQASYSQGRPLQMPYPSSYPNYSGNITQDWVKTRTILSFFDKSKHSLKPDAFSYQKFVEGYKDTTYEIKDVVIED